jgi:hypothetical protein
MTTEGVNYNADVEAFRRNMKAEHGNMTYLKTMSRETFLEDELRKLMSRSSKKTKRCKADVKETIRQVLDVTVKEMEAFSDEFLKLCKANVLDKVTYYTDFLMKVLDKGMSYTAQAGLLREAKEKHCGDAAAIEEIRAVLAKLETLTRPVCRAEYSFALRVHRGSAPYYIVDEYGDVLANAESELCSLREEYKNV